MTSKQRTPNNESILFAQDTGTGLAVPVLSTAGELLVDATLSAPSLPSAAVNGQQTATTSAVALPSGVLTQGVVLEALSTNTVSIFVGTTGVTTGTGYELQPGAAVGIAVGNTNEIYIRCASSTPVVTWIGS